MNSIPDTLVSMCNEIINATDNVLATEANAIPENMTNSTSTNVTYTMPTNSDGKKVRYKIDFYILHALLKVILLLFIIAIIYYHYTKHW